MTNVEQVRLSLSYHRGFLQPICSRCNMLQPLQRGQLRLLHAAREFCRKWLLKWKQKSRKPRPSKRQKNLRAVRAVNSHDVEFQGEMQNDSDGTRLYKTLQDFTRLTLWKRCRFSARQLLQPLQALQQELQSKLAKLKKTEVWAGELSELSWKGFPKAVCLMCLVMFGIFRYVSYVLVMYTTVHYVIIVTTCHN